MIFSVMFLLLGVPFMVCNGKISSDTKTGFFVFLVIVVVLGSLLSWVFG